MSRVYARQVFELLSLIRDHYESRVEKQVLKLRLTVQPFQGLYQSFEYFLSFCEDLCLIQINEHFVTLTPTAFSFLEIDGDVFSPSRMNKCRVLASCCFESTGKSAAIMNQLISKFTRSALSGRLLLNVTDIEESEYDLAGILLCVGAFTEIEGMLVVSEQFENRALSIIKHEELATDLAEFQLILEKRNRIGVLAEKIVLNFERSRLAKLGRSLEASLVKQVSMTNVSAGYDIASFDGAEASIESDRFIEVKGSTGTDLTFYLTKNEFSRAAQLKDKYWLYFVRNVESPRRRDILMIRNLHSHLGDSSKYILDAVLWHIRGNTSELIKVNAATLVHSLPQV
jgi:hypothetical protein